MKTIEGTVCEGKKIASMYGFPTANISIAGNVEPGIYAGEVQIFNATYMAALYVGSERPDVLESHLIGYVGSDFYGQKISITLSKKMRDEIKNFRDEELISLIENDIKSVIDYYKHV